MTTEKMVEENRKIICPVCNKEYSRDEMLYSYDCHGIPYRLICYGCNEMIIDQIGYDGEYYTELDEQIDDDY